MNTEMKNKYNIARKKLRSVCYWIAENKEPLQTIQELEYNIMALRAEMTTLMDILAKGDRFDDDTYTPQMIHRLDEVTRTLCTGAEIMVDEFGLVVDMKNIRNPNA